MEKEIAIRCVDLYKKYPMFKNDRERLKGLFVPRYQPEEFTALNHINVEFKKGEIIGIIGLNGSGKSTLSSIIAGISYPTGGTVEVDGEVSMLSAGAGLENELTGIENIRYKGILLGFEEKQIENMMQDIIDFADIGSHIDQKLKTYSSGMRSRLGFAISVHMDPDILIIDEALSVGDNSFTDRCLDKMNEFKRKGKTILFVSHSVMQMEGFCDKVMWLDKGDIVGIEEPKNILCPYCGFAREVNMMTSKEKARLNPVLKEYQEKYL